MSNQADPNSAVQCAIVDTAVYEPLILALRWLAHQQLFTEAEPQRSTP